MRDLDCDLLAARAQQMGAMLLRGLGLPFAEAELIAAQEADHVICDHEFVSDGGRPGVQQNP